MYTVCHTPSFIMNRPCFPELIDVWRGGALCLGLIVHQGTSLLLLDALMPVQLFAHVRRVQPR